MSLVNKLRTQKLLSFTLILFTLSVGIVIGTLVSTGAKAARDDRQVAPGASQLVIPNPVELSNVRCSCCSATLHGYLQRCVPGASPAWQPRPLGALVRGSDVEGAVLSSAPVHGGEGHA